MDISEITKEKSLLIPVDDPSPVAFVNIYDEGDIWVKTKGCEDCPIELRKRCCGDCPCVLPDGKCYWHCDLPMSRNGGWKPFYCIKNPLPDKCVKRCCIEYKCVAGPKKGKIRRLRDNIGVLQDS